MEDIFKSGLLGLALVATLTFAAVNANEGNNLEKDFGKNRKEIVTKSNTVENSKIKSKKNIHTPL